MWQSTQLFACSMCGKPKSATDAQPFCGPCEIGFRQEQAEDRAREVEERAREDFGPLI